LRNPRARSPFADLVASEVTFLWISAPPVDFCNRLRRAGTPGEPVRTSRARGACAPPMAGTNRCRLRWPPRCVAAAGRPRAATRTQRLARAAFHLAWSAGRGSKYAREVQRAVGRRCVLPFSAYPSTRVTGTARRERWIGFASCRTGQDSPQRPPRERIGSLNESRCLRRAGTHTRTRGVALPGARPDRRPCHAASAEALL